MKVIALLLVTFLVGASANMAVLQELAQIDKDPFGSTLLNAIALNLKTKQQAADVSNLLQGILDDLLVDSQNLENYYADRRAHLDESINSGQSLIDSYQHTIAAVQDSIDTDIATRATEQETLTNSQNALAFEQARLARLGEEWTATVPPLDLDIQDLQDTLSAISYALSKMEAFRASAGAVTSLIQLGSSAQEDLKKVTTQVQGMKKKLSRQSNLYTPLVRELIDLSSRVDQARADRVVDLLNQLQDLLRGALNELQTTRASFIARYNAETTDARDNVLLYTARVSQLEQNIANLSQQIDQGTADLVALNALLNTAQAKLASDQADLASLEAYYADQRPRYDRLVDLVRRVITYFNENVVAVDEYTRSRINGL